jgi:hypothetical protein
LNETKLFLIIEGFTDYIIAITKPATEAKFEKAKADVERLGGKVNYEIHLGLEGLSVSLPTGQLQTMDNRDYVDFVDVDHEGKMI